MSLDSSSMSWDSEPNRLLPRYMADKPPAQKLVYIPLAWHPPLRQADIQTVLADPTRTIQHALDCLRQADIVTRVSCLTDGRSPLYTIRDNGQPQALAQAPGALPRYFPGDLADLSPAHKIVYLALVSDGPLTRFQAASVLRHSESGVKNALYTLEDEGFAQTVTQPGHGTLLFYDLAEETPFPTPPRGA